MVRAQAPLRGPGTGKARAWLKALRLKFYPMSWVTYAIGALAAAGSPTAFLQAAFWAGFAFMCFLEVATVLGNEYFDYASDSTNRCAGPFSGGSRVLVEGLLDFRELRQGLLIALALTALAFLAVLAAGLGTTWHMALLMAVLALLAVGYTVPPLQLSYRTLGELDVGLCDSIGVLLCGYVFLGGAWNDPLPWLLSLPLMLAFIPSITLSGVPDLEADRGAGKRTIAVRYGASGAMFTAQVTAVLAAVCALALWWLGLDGGAYGPLIGLSLLHALVLVWQLARERRRGFGARRIDALMINSLSFVIWFGALPLVRLL